MEKRRGGKELRLGERLCGLLNIDYPILQGAMAWVTTRERVGAVSEGGGLGIIAAGSMRPEHLVEQIERVREFTDRPFGVNIMLMNPCSEELINVVCEKGIQVITTGAGNPGIYMEKLRNAGVKIIPVVASVSLARRMESLGADAVVAEGMEAGGHIGKLTTMTLVRQVTEMLKIPVIAAGGIADGSGLAAAFCLGADGAQIGTRFICSHECQAHDNYKQRIIKSGDLDSVVTGQFTGHPVRSLKNVLTRKLESMERSNTDPVEFERMAIGTLKTAVKDGDIRNGTVMAGQISGLICEIKTVKEIITEILAGAEDILTSFGE